MAMTEEHKRAMAEGRQRAAAARREAKEEAKENGTDDWGMYVRWSKRHAVAWSRWKQECGKLRCDCKVNEEFRLVTSAIPHIGGKNDS